MVVVVEGDVLGQREVEHEPAPLPVLRDVAEPGVEAVAAALVRDVLVPDDDPPGFHLAEAGDRVDQLGLAVAVDAGDADDLAARAPRTTRRGPSRARGRPRPSALRPRAAAPSAAPARLSTRSSTSRPTIRRARLSSVAPAAGSVSIFLPRRSTVIRSAISSHLVQLVADEDDRLPLLGQAPHDREELLRLLRGQHRRRLVEHEDVRAAVERLQDLHPLLLADGDVLDDRARVDCEPEAGRDARCTRFSAVA